MNHIAASLFKLLGTTQGLRFNLAGSGVRVKLRS
jgi:hypothetical protein